MRWYDLTRYNVISHFEVIPLLLQVNTDAEKEFPIETVGIDPSPKIRLRRSCVTSNHRFIAKKRASRHLG